MRERPDDAEARSAWFRAAGEMTPFVGVHTQLGATYLVRAHDRHIGRTLFVKRSRGDMAVLNRAIWTIAHFHGEHAIAGTTFIDAGANIGTTTVTAMTVHSFARAVAAEPERENYDTLRINLILNGVEDRVTALNAALSNEPGVADLIVDRSQSGKHWIANEHMSPKAGATHVTVPVTTIDELDDQATISADDVGLLWIDAQAHEASILEGATKLTARGCPVAFEWDPRSLQAAGQLERLQRLLTQNFTHFVDLRRAEKGPKYSVRESAEIESFTEAFLGPRATKRFTDILAVRLTDGDLGATDLASVYSAASQVVRERKASLDDAGTAVDSDQA